MENLNFILSAIFNGIILLYVAIIILAIAGMWKTYEKAGQPGWACLVPIYGVIILLRIVGKPWWWILLLLVPFVNLIIYVWVSNLLSKSFGKSEGFTVGLVLLGFIFFPILGFGDAKYQGPAAAEAKGGNSFQDLKEKMSA